MDANIVRFGELYEIPSSNGLSRPSAVRGEGFKMINMGELFANNIISNIPMERVQMSDKEQEKFFVKEGDLLFARQSLVAEGAGKCSIVKNFSEPTTFESHLIRVRLNKRSCDSWFYYYLFQLKSNPIKAIINQCAQAGIRGSELVRVKVPHPPLPTQQKIASILSTYDNLIQNYKKQIEDLQTTASELYKEWFVRFRFPGYKTAQFENGIPVGWKVEKIKNYVNRLPFGQTYKKDELEEEGKVIVIDQSEDELLGYHNNEPSHKASSENPIALFGDHSCKYKLMIKDFSLGENIIPYTAKNVDLYYLYYAVYKIVQTEEYKRHWTLFINKKILIPENGLQVKFKKNIIPIYEKIEIIEQQITNLTQQRDLLLPRLMSGKLEIK